MASNERDKRRASPMARRIPINEDKLADLGMYLEVHDEQFYVACDLGSEPLLHPDMEQHVKTELGNAALTELQEATYLTYVGIALRAAIN